MICIDYNVAISTSHSSAKFCKIKFQQFLLVIYSKSFHNLSIFIHLFSKVARTDQFSFFSNNHLHKCNPLGIGNLEIFDNESTIQWILLNRSIFFHNKDVMYRVRSLIDDTRKNACIYPCNCRNEPSKVPLEAYRSHEDFDVFHVQIGHSKL